MIGSHGSSPLVSASDTGHMLTPGIHPFWFWNTTMDEGRIACQLRALAAGGCRGALIHPRQGYPDGYLSGRWRALVAFACREGAALGLEIGACDEFPIPAATLVA
jgi:hypothetical protein